MLLYEFTDNEHPVQGVLALLDVIKSHYASGRATPKINTVSFLNLAKNVGLTLDYESFAELYEKNSTLKNVIKNFNKKYIILAQPDDDSSDHAGPAAQSADAATVSSMANKSVKI